MAQHPLDLQPDDYILYQDEEIREEDRVTFVAPGTVRRHYVHLNGPGAPSASVIR